MNLFFFSAKGKLLFPSLFFTGFQRCVSRRAAGPANGRIHAETPAAMSPVSGGVTKCVLRRRAGKRARNFRITGKIFLPGGHFPDVRASPVCVAFGTTRRAENRNGETNFSERQLRTAYITSAFKWWRCVNPRRGVRERSLTPVPGEFISAEEEAVIRVSDAAACKQ